MKVTLVYPEFPETFWSFSHALKFVSKKASFPPLGLLTVAALLPRSWEVKLVDMNVEPLKEKHLAADLILISAISVQKRSAADVIERCRQAGVKVVAGGPLFTTRHEEFPGVDHFVLDEAEITLPQFLADLAAGKAGRLYRSPLPADLRTTPLPRWDLIDLKHYASLSVQYSRGCPFDCEFCDITLLYGRTMRLKDTGQVLAELDDLYDRGWRGPVFFVDDNFIGNRPRLKADVLPALARWMEGRRHPFIYNTQASINIADDPELMRQMTAAGFTSVFVGIETPSDEGLKECGKAQNRRRNLLDSVRTIQRHGLEVQGGFIVGFDSDSPAIFDRQIAFIQESGIVTAMVGLLNALKGTRLYQRLARENRLLRADSGDNTDGTINFVPRMDMKILLKGYEKIVATIYSPEHFYRRIKEFLEHFNPARRKIFVYKLSYIAAFLKSVFVLGVVGRERVHYWKLIAWTLVKYPRLLSQAVTFMIYGYHYRKIYEK